MVRMVVRIISEENNVRKPKKNKIKRTFLLYTHQKKK